MDKAPEWLTIVNIDAITAEEKYINPISPTLAKNKFFLLDSERRVPLESYSF